MPISTLDVRQMVPHERHILIFQLFDSLEAGQIFVLVSDHAPRSLYYQFLSERANQFSWNYLEEGPKFWRVQVGRI